MTSAKAELIRRASAGDLEAFRELHGEYAHRILNFIYRMVDSREDAEDLTQNVFLMAFRELGKLQDLGRFESWLYRIARNEVYQAFRRVRNKPRSENRIGSAPDQRSARVDFRDHGPSPQDNILNEELGTTIRRVLRSLPEKQREVFILAVVEGRSYAEIADIVGRSLLSVKTDIFRARRFARESLREYRDAL